MSMKKLPNDVQSLFSASMQICNYKRAVEELVYNSLDADSTSIAIRVNIEEHTIQVIDNGCGISKNDFRLLGQRHATSKCVNLATLKSTPNKYGFRGQALWSIIQVAQSVKITSQCHSGSDTWVKSFERGKEKNLAETLHRPSKGTTVEIKGFLYNLKIQRKSVEPLNELNTLKSFLEQVSLVHNNVSLSLRDDIKNDIIFKLHKNRDIYQTLSSMFGINKRELQELKIEKNEYKVTAYIGKKDKDLNLKHWIYLNGKLLQNSKIHKHINDCLIKTLKLNCKGKMNVKSKKTNNYEEENLNCNKIPTYFIFLTIPYYAYDISEETKQTTIDFKNWEQVAKLMEKLIQFYAGDGNLKETKPIKNHANNITKTENATRDQVKKIMEKILGSNPKKICVSQMQNGIKGKIMKRKIKKKSQNVALSKAPKKTVTLENNDKNQIQIDPVEYNVVQPSVSNEYFSNNKQQKKVASYTKENIILQKNIAKPLKCNKVTNKTKSNKVLKLNQKGKKSTEKEKIEHRIIEGNKTNELLLRQKIVKRKQKAICKTKSSPKVDRLLKNFKDDPTGSIQRRCNLLAKKVENLMSFKNKRKRKIFINERIKYSNMMSNNTKYSVRKQVDEIVIHDYVPQPPKLSHNSLDNYIWNKDKLKSCKTSYDLIRTVVRTQETSRSMNCVESPHIITEDARVNENYFNSSIDVQSETYDFNVRQKYTEPDLSPRFLQVPGLTFESHNYNMEYVNRVSHEYNFDDENNPKEKSKAMQFISTRSRDNFLKPTERSKGIFESAFRRSILFKEIKPNAKRNEKCYSKRLKNLSNLSESSYTIEFSSSKPYQQLHKDHVESPVTNISYYDVDSTQKTVQNQDNTYDIKRTDDNRFSTRFNCTYTVTVCESQPRQPFLKNDYPEELEISDRNCKKYDILCNSDKHNAEENTNIVFLSKSQDQDCVIKESISDNFIEPLNFCETILDNDKFENLQTGKRGNDSLFNGELDVDSSVCDRNAYTHEISGKDFESKSRNAESDTKHFKDNKTECILNIQPVKFIDLDKGFTLKNRPRFVPKGMSQIYKNCQTKDVCDYNLARDYYEENIYHKFAQDIHLNLEVYEPGVQNVKELATKAIEKVSNKLNKYNASLVFDGECLKQAKVLGQIDNKFIAAKIMSRSHAAFGTAEYLILFDQHAVHERISLEKNLAHYFDGQKWKSIELGDIVIKLSEDEILYLHNFKDKFNQLGLQLAVTGTGEVLVNAIPEAVLGKNPRPVEIVMKAVKTLILEEINCIKSQSGCISLHPKSIMDLVFSEACRYAIKFGDKLSMSDCVNLLTTLSDCKTPFQCAHGRPVMAVLMDINTDVKKYKFNTSKLQKWAKCKKI